MSQGYLYDTGDELILRKETAGGLVVHLSEEAVEITVGGDTYQGYPIDKTYKELTENVSMLLNEEDGYIDVYHLGFFSDESNQIEGYPYKVAFFNYSDSSIACYAQSDTGTMYAITLNS